MMSELNTALNEILNDKNTNLLPENLKQGVTCLGVEGTLQEGSGGSLRGVVSYKTSEQLLADTTQELNTIGIVQTIDENDEILEVLVYKWNGTEWETLGLNGGVLSNNEYDTAITTCNEILGKSEN